MKLVTRIVGALWALWGLVVFSVTLLIIIIPICLTFLIKDPKGMLVFKWLTGLWMNVFLPLIACPLTVRGKEHFQKGKTYVVVCNHNSLMDVAVSTPFVPGACKTIAKKSFTKVPVFGLVYTRGSVLVDRNSDESRRKSFEEMKKTLQQGLNMVIYPEGTRNRTGQPLKPFHDGAFKLAVASQKEIIPAIIFNSGKILPPEKPFFLWPCKLEMHFLPPISSDNIQGKDLKEKVHKIMWDYITAASLQNRN